MREMSTAAPRIAVGGISLESNDFVPFTAELDDFTGAGFLLEGPAVESLRGTETEVAGALDVIDATGASAVHLLAARGVSSGRLSRSAYAKLRRVLLSALESALPVDGVFLFQHGSMEAVGEDDPEGDIAQAVRALVGPGVPVVMTCDLHGNVTQRMVENLDVLVGYRHYPHDDARDTGRRATALLLRAVAGDIHPVIAHAKLPLILTAFNSTTLTDTPYAQLLREAAELETCERILSASVFLVGSYIDAPDMGCSAVVVGDADRPLAASEAKRLARRFWDDRYRYEVETVSVAEAVRRGPGRGPPACRSRGDAPAPPLLGRPLPLRGRDCLGRRGRQAGAPDRGWPRAPPRHRRHHRRRRRGRRDRARSGPAGGGRRGALPSRGCRPGGRGGVPRGRRRGRGCADRRPPASPALGPPARAARDRPPPARRAVPLRGRHPRRPRRVDGPLRRGRDRRGQPPRHEPADIRLVGRPVPRRWSGPVTGEVRRRQEHDELPLRLRRRDEGVLRSRPAWTDATGHATPSLLPHHAPGLSARPRSHRARDRRCHVDLEPQGDS